LWSSCASAVALALRSTFILRTFRARRASSVRAAPKLVRTGPQKSRRRSVGNMHCPPRPHGGQLGAICYAPEGTRQLFFASPPLRTSIDQPRKTALGQKPQCDCPPSTALPSHSPH
jgi:hypothetical protein